MDVQITQRLAATRALAGIKEACAISSTQLPSFLPYHEAGYVDRTDPQRGRPAAMKTKENL